eukprot:ctg_1166.g477
MTAVGWRERRAIRKGASYSLAASDEEADDTSASTSKGRRGGALANGHAALATPDAKRQVAARRADRAGVRAAAGPHRHPAASAAQRARHLRRADEERPGGILGAHRRHGSGPRPQPLLVLPRRGTPLHRAAAQRHRQTHLELLRHQGRPGRVSAAFERQGQARTRPETPTAAFLQLDRECHAQARATATGAASVGTHPQRPHPSGTASAAGLVPIREQASARDKE